MVIKFFFILCLSLFFLFCNTNTQYPYAHHGILNIDSDNIQDVFNTNEHCLIKFYAPQCVHCKRIWNKIVNLKSTIQNDDKKKVFFGQVNCGDTKGKFICQKYDVLRVPQLKMFKGSELVSTYSNNINDENFVKKWIYYVTTPIFLGVHSEKELSAYITDDNLFLTCSENLSDDLIEVAKLYYDEHYFINIKNQNLCDKLNIKTSQLHVKGLYEHDAYNLDKIEFEPLKTFVNKNRFPLVNKVDHHNFFNLRSSGNNLILLLLDLQREVDVVISIFTEYAKRHKNLKEFIFAYIDGKYYEENLELYGTDSRKYPQIIVFSKRPHEYYFEDYFNLDNLDSIIEDLQNERINTKAEEFTKSKIYLIQLKKHMRYIFHKAFKTDIISFIGFLCSVVMVIFTCILMAHTIYRIISQQGVKHHSQ
ncbi:protein disulfide isomerase, putative [Plasmodium malariae]|uniref:Protein disulfide isomerase, putative n=1 Tax=Plasmodium malariae TaxID=5858 RepID=A0A1D3PBY3_PLAMA|nr:protein disulfide isomerase, putative [Plasmodium malariae]SCN12794.1 protein disulfide isomerase, putative [Plasmodium malariae]